MALAARAAPRVQGWPEPARGVCPAARGTAAIAPRTQARPGRGPMKRETQNSSGNSAVQRRRSQARDGGFVSCRRLFPAAPECVNRLCAIGQRIVCGQRPRTHSAREVKNHRQRQRAKRAQRHPAIRLEKKQRHGAGLRNRGREDEENRSRSRMPRGRRPCQPGMQCLASLHDCDRPERITSRHSVRAFHDPSSGQARNASPTFRLRTCLTRWRRVAALWRGW